MKFNKVDWRVHKLSPDTLSGNDSQRLKLYIVDSVANTQIKSAKVKILGSTRDGETIYLDWVDLILEGEFYYTDFTILNITKATQAKLLVEITDNDDKVDFTNELNVTITV